MLSIYEQHDILCNVKIIKDYIMTQQKNEYDNEVKGNVFLCNNEKLGLILITDK